MKSILLFCLLIPSLSMASPWDWSIVDSKSATGMNTSEIEQVLKDYPMIIDGTDYQASDFDFVQVSEVTFKWVSKTICEEEDERLFYTDLSYLACPKNDIANCIVKISVDLPTEDPCL